VVGEGLPGGAGGGPAGFSAGSRIAGYLLEEEIGAGGMAVVFRARDQRLDRPVALKLLTPGLAGDEEFRRRFLRESRAAAAVDDPHIIPVYEAGEAGGVLFIAMRYVSGGDVRALLRRVGPLPPGRAAVIISSVASALDAAHAAGLVHRDVKPGNMLIDARPGRPDHVYLSDFGLSKSRAASVLTGARLGPGTVAYMAPEQIEGGEVDGRADQYALGCAAFELLCGTVPFERDQDMAMIYAHLSALPPPLSSRRADLPPACDAVLGRALAKAPDDRYPSCGEFAEALRQALGLPGYDPDPNLLAEVATDGTGNKVLTGTTVGRAQLLDFSGGPAIALGEAVASGAGFRGVVDNDVCFTVYRPQALSPGVWASLLVFAHKTELIREQGRAPVDPVKQVEDMAAAHFGDVPVRRASEDSRSGVFRGAWLRVVADLPGIRCDPEAAEFHWQEPVHQVVFRLLAGPELVGSAVRGAVRVWLGMLLLGEVFLAISVTASAPEAGSPAVAESAPRYRKIFPSYSHDDRAIVDDFAEKARALGDQYLQDVLVLRSGERRRARLAELIEEADIFQLFWSSNSMRSQYCKEEWEQALALRRPLFVRPLYWEDPMPQDPALGLPPAALLELQFVKVPPYTPPPRPAPEQLDPSTPPVMAAVQPPQPAGPPEQAWQGPPEAAKPPQPPTEQPRGTRSGRKRGLTAALSAAGVAATGLIVAAVALSGAQSHGITAASSPSTRTAAHASPTASPMGQALPAGVAPLTQLLPSDINDPATQCTAMSPPFQWEMPGLVQALSCTDPGLPKGQVYAFQMSSHSNFEAAWQNYNKWWGIGSLSPGTNCPPVPGRAGIVGFRNRFFPLHPGQVLECRTVASGSNIHPAYTWAYPTEYAFIVAQGAPGSSFSALDSWWRQGSAPVSSPEPEGSTDGRSG
jgi:Protein kinase domain/TIR domain